MGTLISITYAHDMFRDLDTGLLVPVLGWAGRSDSEVRELAPNPNDSCYHGKVIKNASMY